MLLLTRKGTGLHPRLGWAYCAAAAVLAGSSFGIYQLRDGPSVSHAVSVVLLIVVGIGFTQPRWRRAHPAWRYWHAVWMPASLLMIVVTGVAQFFDQLPLPSDALNAVLFLPLPGIVGFILLLRIARRHAVPR